MTTLYIKTHNITGLKYFGKTIKQDVHKYKGSGIYWTNHINKYGYDVTTKIYAQFESNDCNIIDVALDFSEENNIVESKEWANLKPENGLDGVIPGTKFTEEHKLNLSIARQHFIFTDEIKQKLRIPATEEAKVNMRKSRNRPWKGRGRLNHYIMHLDILYKLFINDKFLKEYILKVSNELKIKYNKNHFHSIKRYFIKHGNPMVDEEYLEFLSSRNNLNK